MSDPYAGAERHRPRVAVVAASAATRAHQDAEPLEQLAEAYARAIRPARREIARAA